MADIVIVNAEPTQFDDIADAVAFLALGTTLVTGGVRGT